MSQAALFHPEVSKDRPITVVTGGSGFLGAAKIRECGAQVGDAVINFAEIQFEVVVFQSSGFFDHRQSFLR